jgi:hypothetical protein
MKQWRLAETGVLPKRDEVTRKAEFLAEVEAKSEAAANSGNVSRYLGGKY